MGASFEEFCAEYGYDGLNPFEIRAWVLPNRRYMICGVGRLNPFEIRAWVLQMKIIKRNLASIVSIPLKSGHGCFTCVLASMNLAKCLNPFEIRAWVLRSMTKKQR